MLDGRIGASAARQMRHPQGHAIQEFFENERFGRYYGVDSQRKIV